MMHTSARGAMGPLKFEEKHLLGPADLAAFIRGLADELARGDAVEIVTSAQQVGIILQEPLTLKISYKEDPKKMIKRLRIDLQIEEAPKFLARPGKRPAFRYSEELAEA